jgi:hypothetical protein
VLIVHGPVEPRDTDMVRSLDAIREVAPVGATIGACSASAGDWGLRNYLQRFYRISIDVATTAADRDWFVASNEVCLPPPHCSIVVPTERFAFAKCRGMGPPTPTPGPDAQLHDGDLACEPDRTQIKQIGLIKLMNKGCHQGLVRATTC